MDKTARLLSGASREGHEGSNPSTSSVVAEWFDDGCFLSSFDLEESFLVTFSDVPGLEFTLTTCIGLGEDEPLPCSWTVA